MDENIELWLLRHGVSIWNKMDIHQGQSWIEPGIAPEGVLQARHIGELLRDKTVLSTWSSPLIRACQTAIIIASYQKNLLPLIIHRHGLMEITNGKIDGLPFHDIKKQFPERWKLWEEKIIDIHTPLFPEGESLIQVANRGERSLLKIVQHASMMQQNISSKNGIVIVVSHGVINSLTLAKISGIPLMQAMDEFPQSNGCINILHWNGLQFSIKSTNDTQHLNGCRINPYIVI